MRRCPVRRWGSEQVARWQRAAAARTDFVRRSRVSPRMATLPTCAQLGPLPKRTLQRGDFEDHTRTDPYRWQAALSGLSLQPFGREVVSGSSSVYWQKARRVHAAHLATA